MGKQVRLKKMRSKCRATAERVIEKPPHADRWPLEFLPWIGRIIRRRRLKKNALIGKIHGEILKKAIKSTARRLTDI